MLVLSSSSSIPASIQDLLKVPSTQSSINLLISPNLLQNKPIFLLTTQILLATTEPEYVARLIPARVHYRAEVYKL
jgi:hypothetical protein